MMWHAATVEVGDKVHQHPSHLTVLCSFGVSTDLLPVRAQVRVNYYIREFYGDPEVYTDAWAAPFGVLALNGPTSIFIHPMVNKVLCVLDVFES